MGGMETLAFQAGILASVLWLRRLIISAVKRREGKHAAAPTDDPAVMVMDSPRKSYRAYNPPWLVEAVSGLDPDDTPALECPAVLQWLEQAQARAAAGEPVVEFGEAALKELFQLDLSFAYLNHGSYGATLRLVAEAQAWWQRRQEAHPVRFMETEALRGLLRAQHALAALVSASPADIVFFPNATAAANAVLRSPGIALQEGSYVLLTDLTYAAVKSAAARAAAEAGAGLVEVKLIDILGDDTAVVERFQAGLAAVRGRVALAIVDHIISPLPVHLPVRELCTLCQQHGVPTLVDGAHAVGAVTLDLPSLGATYYTSNLHKWACSSKGAAFLWVERGAQAGVAPLVTSHGYGLGFQGEFLWQGTRDYTPFLSLTAALSILRAVGLERAARYRHSLLAQAAALLREAWGTQQVLGLNSPESCMAAVELPLLSKPTLTSATGPSTTPPRNCIGTGGGSSNTPPPPTSAQSTERPGACINGSTAAALHGLLRERYKVEVPVLCMRGVLWVRISAQIYNQLGNYRRLAEAVLDVRQRGLLG